MRYELLSDFSLHHVGTQRFILHRLMTAKDTRMKDISEVIIHCQ